MGKCTVMLRKQRWSSILYNVTKEPILKRAQLKETKEKADKIMKESRR
jgi:hypothetical protein